MAVKPGGASSPLRIVGLRSGDEHFYRSILRSSGGDRVKMSEVTGLNYAELDELLDRFTALGLVHRDDETVEAVAPADVLGQLIAGETERLQRERDEIDALRNLLPTLITEHLTASQPRGGAVAVHAADGDVVGLVHALVSESSGDLLWFRPDQWRLPVGGEVDEVVRRHIAAGRRSRAIYPARVLEEAPQALRVRTAAGEQVRIVADVPARISIMGTTAALISDRWGSNTGRRLVVREHGLVGALTSLFEHVWDRGMAVPGMDPGVEDVGGQRRLLLHQLAMGAKDEHIARTLGVSLRTVRRRIAELMEELSAESRFQAGAEAVRRGWL